MHTAQYSWHLCVLQFAAVLNEKKAKAIEWKQKAEQAQETAQKASNEVSPCIWRANMPASSCLGVKPACKVKHISRWCCLHTSHAVAHTVQGIAVEGTPPHDFADTYSQSTDPSDDDQGNIADNSHEPETSSALDSHAVSHEPPKASAQPAQQHQSLEEQPSVALDTQNDPAENSDMQEGEACKCTM